MRPSNQSEKPADINYRPTDTFVVPAVSAVPTVAYHELADVPVQRIDLVEQIQSNLQTLNDLQSRMQFMMREIRYLLKV